MNKAQLIALVKDATGQEFGDRTIALKMGMVFTDYASQLFGTNLNQWEYYSRQVTLNVANRVAALTIPLIQSRLNGNGCPRIVPTGASCECIPDTTVFYPAPTYGLNIEVDATTIEGMVYYTVTNSEIRFSRSLPAGVTEVTATVIPTLEYYGDDETITLPSGIAQMIVDATIAVLKGQPAPGNIYKRST